MTVAIQAGLDGSVKLANRTHASIAWVLTHTLDRYEQFTSEVAHDADDQNVVYWRIVFAILSVHTHFSPNVKAYQMLRTRGFPTNPDPDKRVAILTRWLARVKADGGQVIQFPGQKARYLDEFNERWDADPCQFTRNGETSEEWRDRIQTIRGLARTKASFAVCLADPKGSDVICIDRHMARLLTGAIPKSGLPKGIYTKCEDRIRSLAARRGATPFAVQWCLWDAMRGHIEDHGVLAAA